MFKIFCWEINDEQKIDNTVLNYMKMVLLSNQLNFWKRRIYICLLLSFFLWGRYYVNLPTHLLSLQPYWSYFDLWTIFSPFKNFKEQRYELRFFRRWVYYLVSQKKGFQYMAEADYFLSHLFFAQNVFAFSSKTLCFYSASKGDDYVSAYIML